MPVIEMAGQKFGRLLVLSRAASDPKGNARWLCSCDCGNSKSVLGQSLRIGVTVSCGCYHSEAVSKRARTHGSSATRGYGAWSGMIQRCTNPNSKKWHRYGGRGIEVCAQWRTYEGFHADMGDRPDWASIDRINNDGNYEPSNCRWATAREQQNNMSTNHHISVCGDVMTIAEAGRRFGVKTETIRGRIRSGWAEDRAAQQPTTNEGN